MTDDPDLARILEEAPTRSLSVSLDPGIPEVLG